MAIQNPFSLLLPDDLTRRRRRHHRHRFGKVNWLCCCLLFFVILHRQGTVGMRVKRSSFVDEKASIRTEYVDKNNQTILDMFNLTRAQLSRIAAGNSAANKEAAATARDSHFFEDIKEHRINDIKVRLQSAFQGGTSEESQEHPLHEMAAYPICNAESNESSWLHDNNVTIRFSDSLFEPKHDNLNLDSAILRLYKINPNGTDNMASALNIEANHKPKRCINPLLDSQIRVTVSIVQQLRKNKRERKKRICNTIMMNVSQTGWVEIDIKRAIYIWESVERQQQQQQQHQQQHQQQQHQQQQHQQQHHHHQPQPTPIAGRQPILVGWLLIEVHDEEERPLKPGLFFKPPKCDQADLAIPWNYYRPHTSMSSVTEDQVPRSPRLDVKLIGYASFAPKQLQNKQLHDQLHLKLRRQLSQTSAENDNELTTVFTPTADNLLEASASTSTEMLHRHRKRHSHLHQHMHHQQQQQQQHLHGQNRPHRLNKRHNQQQQQQVQQHQLQTQPHFHYQQRQRQPPQHEQQQQQQHNGQHSSTNAQQQQQKQQPSADC